MMSLTLLSSSEAPTSLERCFPDSQQKAPPTSSRWGERIFRPTFNTVSHLITKSVSILPIHSICASLFLSVADAQSTSSDPEDPPKGWSVTTQIMGTAVLAMGVAAFCMRKRLLPAPDREEASRGDLTIDRNSALLEIITKTYLPKESPSRTCFICFNVSEKNIGGFLRKRLVPDLEMAGFTCHFCFRDLKLGDDLYSFMSQARTDDTVVIICTPELKKKVEQEAIGVSYEITKMIVPRIEDKGINDHGVFLVYYAGSRSASCPHPLFTSDFNTKLLADSDDNWEMHYYLNAFRLIAAMKGVDRDTALGYWERRKSIPEASIQKVMQAQRNKKEIPEKQVDVDKIIAGYKAQISENKQTRRSEGQQREATTWGNTTIHAQKIGSVGSTTYGNVTMQF